MYDNDTHFTILIQLSYYCPCMYALAYEFIALRIGLSLSSLTCDVWVWRKTWHCE